MTGVIVVSTAFYVIPMVLGCLAQLYPARTLTRLAAARILNSAARPPMPPPTAGRYFAPLATYLGLVVYQCLFALYLWQAKPVIGLGFLVCVLVTFIPVILKSLRGISLVYSEALRTWAMGSGLPDDDLLVASRDLVERSNWRWLAFSGVPNALFAAAAILASSYRPDRILPVSLAVLLACLLGWAGLRATDIAFPTARFLTDLGAAIRADSGSVNPPKGAAARGLEEHRAQTWGRGGAELLRALPPLRSSVLSHVRRYPALCEKAALKAVEPLLAELMALAAAGPITPGPATRRALDVAVRGDLGVVDSDWMQPRSLDDDKGWLRPPTLLPGDIGRWLPSTFAKLVAALGAVAASTATIITLGKGL